MQINQAGQMSGNKRNETQLLCDVLGLESLVDEITSKLLLLRTPQQQQQQQYQHASAPTPSAVLGPFYRAGAPLLPHGASILQAAAAATTEAASRALVAGRVRSASTGQPIGGATLDVWQAAPNGLYEQQDAGQPDMNLRGRFESCTPSGAYALRCLRPVAYPIPDDGPAGRLLGLLDRHPYRPGHGTSILALFSTYSGNVLAPRSYFRMWIVSRACFRSQDPTPNSNC
jgi:catechol 1,2-dioxygenase